MIGREELLVDYQDFYCRYYDMFWRELESFKYCVDHIDMIINSIHKDSKVLEFGCGVGFNLNYLYVNGFKNLYGVDIDNRMINEAKRRFEEIEFGQLPTLNRRNFDLIFTRAVLQEQENTDTDIIEILKTLYVLLKDDGILITVEGQAVRTWVKLFLKGGFKLELQRKNLFKWRKIISDG